MNAHDAELVAVLVEPDTYRHHLNQVASVTTEAITFIKRKFVSRAGAEVVTYPMSRCTTVAYCAERPVAKVIGGALLTLLMVALIAMLVLGWDELSAETSIPIGAMTIAGLAGLRWTFRARRHHLTFTFDDGTELQWKSRAGDFGSMKGPSERVVAFARSAGLLAQDDRAHPRD
jgi:hypothetical protein